MKKILVSLLLGLPLVGLAEDYHSTLLVQTGTLRESDLIVRTVSDLESNKTCLTFYISTAGTSPVMTCYEARSGFRSEISQVGHFKEGKLVVRKLKDSVNNVSCLVAYVSTAGTSPALDCYNSRGHAKDSIKRSGHLKEGDLDIYKIQDANNNKSCLVGFVDTEGTSPTLKCYDSPSGPRTGGMTQTSYLKQGDLIVRKIVDQANLKECLVSYVSTAGTSPYIYCSDVSAASFPPPANTQRTFAPKDSKKK
ncbi:MAG: hypothetical protein GY807_04230 [Gammaproteobacteria bacterium]|nr:hypothetical protein [Gammaproteobacteria bacterium]